VIDRKAAVKPNVGRPRAVLGNISNKAAPPARTDGTKVVAVVNVYIVAIIDEHKLKV